MELFGGWRLALRRLAAGWRLMLVAAVGVLAASTLLAMTPIYASAMTDLGLQYRLRHGLERPDDALAAIEVERLLIADPGDRARREAVDRLAEARVGWLGPDVLVEERTPRLDLAFAGREGDAPPQPVTVTQRAAEPVRQPWGAFVYHLGGFERHVEVTEGRLPGPSSSGAEAVLPDGFQRHARVGDVVRVSGPSIDDCPNVPGSEDPSVAADEVRCVTTVNASTSATATIVGFVRPRDAEDTRWLAFAGGWAVPDEPLAPRIGQVPRGDPVLARALAGEQSMSLLTTHEQFFGAFAERMPEQISRHRVAVAVDLGALRVDDVPRAIEDLRAWNGDVNERLQIQAPMRPTVVEVLERYRSAQTFSQIPLLIILLQVVGIVLYYVVVVMAVLLERQAAEIAVLRSRGATTAQLLGLHLVEGLVLAAPAAVAGPWLGARIVAAVGRTPAFSAITGGAPLHASVTPGAVLLGAVGAALALVAILLPALLVTRRGIIEAQRVEARPSGPGIVQRYYLDVGVVALAALLLWQLRQRGSVFEPGAIGGWSSDPLLLLAPVAVTLAVAMVVLRLYPPLVRLVVRLLLTLRGTAVAIGLRRAGRAPAAYARLMLLMVMAVSVGTFAASYGPTVGRSLDERVRYTTGADVRYTTRLTDRLDEERGIEQLRGVEGVADAALAYRGTITSLGGGAVPALALDPARAASMLWSRADFAATPLPEALRLLETDVPPGRGLAVPDDTRTLEVRVRSKNLQRMSLIARFRDARGNVENALLRPPADAGEAWVVAVADVPERSPRPLTLLGIGADDRSGEDLRQPAILHLDAITAVRASGPPTILEDFEVPLGWTMYSMPGTEETLRIGEGNAASGRQFADWRWGSATSARKRLMAPSDPAVPLPVLMDPGAMAAFGVFEGGDTLMVVNGFAVPVVVRARVDLFPTLDPEDGFAIVNEAHLQSIATTLDVRELRVPNEAWLRFEDGVPLAQQRAIVRDAVAPTSPLPANGQPLHQAAMLDDTSADPTLQVAGSGILTVAFIAVLALSTLGFAVTLVLGARARSIEFAVLRAVGSSRQEILRALVIEWGTVLVLGAAIGTLLGRQVAQVMLRFLEVTDRGDRVLPPFIVLTNWPALALGIGALLAVVAVTLALSWAAAMRRPTAAELRFTR